MNITSDSFRHVGDSTVSGRVNASKNRAEVVLRELDPSLPRQHFAAAV